MRTKHDVLLGMLKYKAGAAAEFLEEQSNMILKT